jgi:predicted ATPase/DNA-binding XRE family transcriptional regulator
MAALMGGHPSALGVLLRQHRVEAGLTQEELAERAGISLRGLVALENGERLRPRRDTVQLLADALQLGGGARRHFEAVSRGRDVRPRIDGICQAPEQTGTEWRKVGPSLAGRSLTPLVGRARELEFLEWHLSGLGPPVLMFAGEPGIGKTRLLGQAAEMAGRRGQAVVIGGCQRRSGQEPYAPFPRAIARYLAGLPAPAREELVRESRWLVRLLPELAPLLPEPPTSTWLEAGQERRLLFDAVARLLAHLAGDEGTVLLLDDLQWAPADALDLLTALTHEATSSRLRIVGAYRTTDVRPADPLALMLADGAHAGVVRQVSVEALSPQESEQLLIGLAGDVRASSGTVRQAVTRTGGVPFYLVSYAQELRAKGAGADSDVPWEVAHSVRQRAAALPARSQEVLAVAAIAGRVVSRAVLAHALGRTEVELLSALEMTCRARLLEEAGERAYRFPHDVIREAIEADLGTARRTLLHRMLGEALEQVALGAHAGGAAELAWHFLEAGDAERALRYSLQAGDTAAAMFAHEEAEKRYRTAVDLARELKDRAMQIEGLLKLGVVLNNVGQLDEALAVLEEAAGYGSAAGALETEVQIIAQIGRVQERRGAVEEGITRLEPLLHCFEDTQDVGVTQRPALAALLLALGDLYYQAGRYPEELRVAEQAVELAQQLGQERLITAGARQRGLALLSLGRREEAVRAWTTALPLMEATDDLYNLSHTLNNLSDVSLDRTEATQYVERALKVAERLGDPSQIAFMTVNLAAQEYAAGRWREARILGERSWELAGPRGLLMAGYAALLLGEIDLAEGNFVEGRRWLEVCASIAQDSNLLATRLAQQLLAEQDLLAERPDLALARLMPLLDRPNLEEAGSTGLLHSLARTYLELGDTQRAGAIVQDGLRRATLLGYPYLIAELLLVRGVVAVRGGSWEDAACSFDEALIVARRWPYPYIEGRTVYERGLMENRRGRPERARASLEEALLIFGRLGACPYQERAELALAALAIESPGA